MILQTLSGASPYRGLQNMPSLPRPVSLSIIFLLSVAVMARFGQAVSPLFVQFRPLPAYRLDVAGSIAGIVVFTALSFLGLPPMSWVCDRRGRAGVPGRAAAPVVAVGGDRRCLRATRHGLVRAARAVVALLQAFGQPPGHGDARALRDR